MLVARGEVALEETAARARALGAEAYALPADLSDRDAATAVVEEAVERLGGLDVVVSNAGAVVFGHFLEVEPDDFDRTLAVTFGGAVNLLRAALPHLRESEGTIIAVSSMMARLPLPAFSSYTASKHALRGSSTRCRSRSASRHRRADRDDQPRAAGHADLRTRDERDRPEPRAAVRRLPPRRDRQGGREGVDEPPLRADRRRRVEADDRALRDRPPGQELALVFVDRWYRIGGEPAPSPGSLYTGNDRARIGDGHPAAAAAT